METKYEYKFVRIEAGIFGMQKAEKNYREVIRTHAELGWRLVQVFAPSASGGSSSKFYEMIFEKEARF